MNTMTRWYPFKSLTRVDPFGEFDEFFRNPALRPTWNSTDIVPDVRIDITEDDGAYHVKADIPGVKKEDIEVSVDGNQVSISASYTREKEQKEGSRAIVTERSLGQATRSFALPTDVAGEKAQAHYDNGVLSLTLPKKSDGNARKIAVN
ncbi:Hsp20/alpha crystallin family protein [Dyella japonica]|uniref:HSP20 family protein n=1 Tax=Dyella japonica TaxID=231455 RepID=A0ABV2JSB7_9GAMM